MACFFYMAQKHLIHLQMSKLQFVHDGVGKYVLQKFVCAPGLLLTSV